MTRGAADDRARDRHPLLLAAADSSRGNASARCGEPDGGERVARLEPCERRTLAAHVEREADVLGGRQGGKQMIGLEDEADMLAPQRGELLGPEPGGRMAADADRAAGRRQHAAEHGQERGLAAARRAHQQGELAAGEREIDALERLDAPGALAEHLGDVGGFDHGLRHWANTMAGSIRVTTRIAEIAAMVHIATVSSEQAERQDGRHDDRQRRVGGRVHDQQPDRGRDREADHGAEQRLDEDDLEDVARARSPWRAASRTP